MQAEMKPSLGRIRQQEPAGALKREGLFPDDAGPAREGTR